MKRYFLGMAAGYTRKQLWAHTFAVGRQQDCNKLRQHLNSRYTGETILCKNGRSALVLALKAYFKPGEAVIVNGFTCYAVYEAVKAARLKPIWTDIATNDLNYDLEKLKKNIDKNVKGIIIQNSLGNAINIAEIEKISKKHNLIIIEDLAHCAGVVYPDGREVGTVGAATILSFGKDKMIDTISGGAVVFRHPRPNEIIAPSKLPKLSDHLRARFYPLFGAVCRRLTSVHLGGALMHGLVKIHWVEKSADNKLDLTRKISKFEAKLALEQFKKLRKAGEPPLREFYLVRDRIRLLAELQQNGYYFSGFWYEKPVSPARYYQKVHFPETECPVAAEVAEQIVNLPTYYSQAELAPARKIIEKYLVSTENKQGKESSK